ncbi:unnamed protein product [Linum trigynum]|uniref:Reverse transcriptase zinc-binding domain-containing protein n=1 Tax=Linum trigynum TaxID=586398 RepID=A0AAV2CKG4_9ROSI
MAIPLPIFPVADHLIWHYEVSGEYSVKSGYRLAAAEYIVDVSTIPSSFDCRSWKFLWSLPVPPKLKIFLWRVVKGFLPVRDVFRDKELIADDDIEAYACPVCGGEAETLAHCFLHCRIALELWDLLGYNHILAQICLCHVAIDWRRLFFDASLSKVEISRLVFLYWRLWKSRCSATYDGIQYLSHVLLRHYYSQVAEWVLAQAHPERSLPRCSPVSSGVLPRDHPPPSIPPGSVLVHFDGATKSLVGCAIGFVGFAEANNSIFAWGRFIPNIDDSFLAELLALRDSLRWCMAHSITNVSFCGDAQVIVRMINAKDSAHAVGGALLQEIQVLRASFLRATFHFALRRYNRAAHIVARQALGAMVQTLVDHRVLFI